MDFQETDDYFIRALFLRPFQVLSPLSDGTFFFLPVEMRTGWNIVRALSSFSLDLICVTTRLEQTYAYQIPQRIELNFERFPVPKSHQKVELVPGFPIAWRGKKQERTNGWK